MSLTKIDLGISVAGHGPNKKDQRYIHITRGDVLQRIKKHPAIDPWTKEYLYKRVNDYPDSALVFFVQNINQIVINAINERNRIMKEQYDENKKRSAESQTDRSIEHQQSGDSGSGEGVSGAKGEKVDLQSAQETSNESEEQRESLFSRSSS